MRRLILGMAMLTSAASAAPSGQEITAEIAPKTVRTDRFPDTPATFPRNVIALPDIEFANLVGYRPLTLDLYLHAGGAHEQRRPLVIWVHGGGWSRGDARTSAAFSDWPAVLGSLAARGYVVASVNYRLTGEARFPAAIQDVRAAIRYLRANAEGYGIDPDRVILWGGSAGAHLAAMAGLTCSDPAFAPEPSTGRAERGDAAARSMASDCVQGLVTWYGLFDLTQSMAVNVTALLGRSERDCTALAKTASPVTHVAKGAPPMLLIHGTSDATVAMAQSVAMATRMRAAGNRAETVFIAGADHGWMSETHEATSAAHLRALRSTFVFIDSIAYPHGRDATAQ